MLTCCCSLPSIHGPDVCKTCSAYIQEYGYQPITNPPYQPYTTPWPDTQPHTTPYPYTPPVTQPFPWEPVTVPLPWITPEFPVTIPPNPSTTEPAKTLDPKRIEIDVDKIKKVYHEGKKLIIELE
jgi:hypothetical protein